MITAYVDKAPLGTGKTTRMVYFIANLPTRAVYVVPAYEQLVRFETEWKKLGWPRKVTMLEGKRRLCLRDKDVRMACSGCPYKKIIKITPLDNYYRPEIYSTQKVCPYFNLLEEAKDAHIIITHILNLYELMRTDKLPYEPSKTTLFVDEGDAVIRSIKLKPYRILSLSEDPVYNWTQLKEHGYLNIFGLIISGFAGAHGAPCDKLKIFYGEYKKILDPNTYKNEACHSTNDWQHIILEHINKELPVLLCKYNTEIGCELVGIAAWITTNPPILKRLQSRFNLPDIELIKRDFLDWLWSVVFAEKVDSRFLQGTNTTEVYLIPLPYIAKMPLLELHKEIYLASGSIQKEDILALNVSVAASSNLNIIEMQYPVARNQDYLLVLTSKEEYNVRKLCQELSRLGYITYIIQSSYNNARKLSIRGLDIRTPKKNEEIDSALRNGINTFNLVQGSPLSTNNRLIGDVAIVKSYISREVEYYSDYERLKEDCILRNTYQALGRILNWDRRHIVAVINEEILGIVEEKFKEVNATFSDFHNEEEALLKIRSWIDKPVGKNFVKRKKEIALHLNKQVVDGKDYYRLVGSVPQDIVRSIPSKVKVNVDELLRISKGVVE